MKAAQLRSLFLGLVVVCAAAIPSASANEPASQTSRESAAGSMETAVIDNAAETLGLSDKEITIGSCVPLTGALKERGQQITMGATMYFNYLNEQGGINGRKIKLTSCDDAYDPDKAIECFNTCLRSKVFAGSFFAGSAPIGKYVRLGELTKTPMFGFCTGNPVAYSFHPTEFVLRPSYADEVHRQIDELINKRHVRKIALIYQNDASGAAVRETLEKDMQKFHESPVAEASFTRKAPNIDAPLIQVKAADPEVIIFVGTGEALISWVKKHFEQKLPQLFLTYSIADDYVIEMGKESDDIVLTQVVPPLDESLPAVVLYNKLRRKYYADSQPNFSAFEAMLNAMVLSEGLKRAGKDLTRTKFIKAMESIHNFDMGAGPSFKVNYSPTNHNGLTSKSVYFTVMKAGALVPIKDSDWKKLLPKH